MKLNTASAMRLHLNLMRIAPNTGFPIGEVAVFAGGFSKGRSIMDLERMKMGLNLTKLPKGVQSYILELERTVQALRASRAPHEGSMISWGYGGLDLALEHGNIPTGSPVKFHLDDEKNHYITCRMEHDELHIHTSHTMQIEPRASNTIRIRNKV